MHVSGDLKKMSTELFLIPNYMKMVRFSTANYCTYESHNLLKMQNEAAPLMLISLYSIKIISGEIFKLSRGNRDSDDTIYYSVTFVSCRVTMFH